MSDTTQGLSAARAQVEACEAATRAQPDDASLREAWVQAVVALFGAYLAVPNLDAAREQLNALDTAAQRHKDDPILYGVWADALFEMIEAYYAGRDYNQANVLMMDFIARTPSHPPEEQAARCQWTVRAARFAKVIGRFGYTGAVNSARPFLHGITHAIVEAPHDVSLRKLWAGAALDFVAGYCRGDQKNSKVDQLEAAHHLVDRLKSCALDHKHEVYLRDYWAKGMHRLVLGYCAAGRGGDGLPLLDTLKRNSDSLPDDLVLRDQWAKSMVRMVAAYEAGMQVTEARALTDELKQAVAKYPTDIDLHTQWTRALWPMARTYLTAERHRQEPRRQKRRQEETLAIIRDHEQRAREGRPSALVRKEGQDWIPLQRFGPPPKPSLWEKWREGRHQKLSKRRAAQDYKALQSFLKDAFKQVPPRCPKKPEQRALWAARAENLFGVAGFLPDVGLVDIGRVLEASLLQAALAYPNESALRTHWATAINRMSAAVKKNEKPQYARKGVESKAVVRAHVVRMADALDQSLKDLPQDLALVGAWAENTVGRLGMVAQFRDSGLRQRGDVLLDVLQAATEKQPQNDELRGFWVKGVLALFGAYRADYDADGAQKIFDGFERAIKSRPDEAALHPAWRTLLFEMLSVHRFDMAPYGTRPHDMKPHEAAMRGLLETLGQEVENEPENQELRKAWSWQVASSVAWQQVAPMRPFLDALKGASERYPDEPDLRAKWLDACFTILYRCHPHGQAEEARSVLSVLEAEARADPQDGEFRRTWVHRAHLFNDELKRVNEDDASAAVQGQIGQMIADYPDEPNLARKHEPVPDEYRWSM